MRPSLLRCAAQSLGSQIPKSISIGTLIISNALVNRGVEKKYFTENLFRSPSNDTYSISNHDTKRIPRNSVDLLVLLTGSASNKSMHMTSLDVS